MKKFAFGFTVFVVGAAAIAVAQQQKMAAPPTQKPMTTMVPSLSGSTKFYYDAMKMWMTKGADMIADKDYGWHPTTAPAADKQEIRTFGALVAHVADGNYLFCGTATGMKGPADSVEKTKKTKADIAKALAESFAFCDKAWAATDDKNAGTPVQFPEALRAELPGTSRLGALVQNTTHLGEHYGNMVVYLRVKGLVPPSSQPAK